MEHEFSPHVTADVINYCIHASFEVIVLQEDIEKIICTLLFLIFKIFLTLLQTHFSMSVTVFVVS